MSVIEFQPSVVTPQPDAMEGTFEDLVGQAKAAGLPEAIPSKLQDLSEQSLAAGLLREAIDRAMQTGQPEVEFGPGVDWYSILSGNRVKDVERRSDWQTPRPVELGVAMAALTRLQDTHNKLSVTLRESILALAGQTVTARSKQLCVVPTWQLVSPVGGKHAKKAVPEMVSEFSGRLVDIIVGDEPVLVIEGQNEAGELCISRAPVLDQYHRVAVDLVAKKD